MSSIPERSPAWTVFGIFAFAFLIGSQILGFAISPPDRDMGNLQKIMYVHVPAAWMTFLRGQPTPPPRPLRKDRRAPLAAKRPSALSGYASDSEFSVCRCGSNRRYNRVNSDKPIDPGLLLQRQWNA